MHRDSLPLSGNVTAPVGCRPGLVSPVHGSVWSTILSFYSEMSLDDTCGKMTPTHCRGPPRAEPLIQSTLVLRSTHRDREMTVLEEPYLLLGCRAGSSD